MKNHILIIIILISSCSNSHNLPRTSSQRESENKEQNKLNEYTFFENNKSYLTQKALFLHEYNNRLILSNIDVRAKKNKAYAVMFGNELKQHDINLNTKIYITKIIIKEHLNKNKYGIQKRLRITINGIFESGEFKEKSFSVSDFLANSREIFKTVSN